MYGVFVRLRRILGPMEGQSSINPEKMNCLRQMKLKGTWEELLHNYENYRPEFLPGIFKDMSPHDVQAFSRFSTGLHSSVVYTKVQSLFLDNI